MINFSVIIPHKNRPEMLLRCLDSIPRRDDVQIIVVDDNSDPKQVDFENFPGLNDNHIEVYFTKKGKGAGYARNVGLKHAKGKWVLFADSDDWYLENLSEMMDKYVDSDFDMLIFRHIRINSNGAIIPSVYDEMFDEAIATRNYDKIICYYACPWSRFIRSSIIVDNQVKFQQVRYSNDVMFALKVSFASKQISIIDEQLYCVYESENSLVRNINWKNYYTRTKVALKAQSYINARKCNVEYPWKLWYSNLMGTNKFVAVCLIPNICHAIGIRGTAVFFKDRFRVNYPKYYKKLASIVNFFKK